MVREWQNREACKLVSQQQQRKQYWKKRLIELLEKPDSFQTHDHVCRRYNIHPTPQVGDLLTVLPIPHSMRKSNWRNHKYSKGYCPLGKKELGYFCAPAVLGPVREVTFVESQGRPALQVRLDNFGQAKGKVLSSAQRKSPTLEADDCCLFFMIESCQFMKVYAEPREVPSFLKAEHLLYDHSNPLKIGGS